MIYQFTLPHPSVVSFLTNRIYRWGGSYFRSPMVDTLSFISPFGLSKKKSLSYSYYFKTFKFWLSHMSFFVRLSVKMSTCLISEYQSVNCVTHRLNSDLSYRRLGGQSQWNLILSCNSNLSFKMLGTKIHSLLDQLWLFCQSLPSWFGYPYQSLTKRLRQRNVSHPYKCSVNSSMLLYFSWSFVLVHLCHIYIIF